MSEHDRYETYQAVPAGYNLLDAPQRELDLYGIPPRPDSSAEEQFFRFWKKLVSPPFRKIDPGLHILDNIFTTQPPNNLESSLNWSGAVVSPPWPKRITLAVAGWIVPKVSHPSTPALFTDKDEPKTLVWVGLDGHNGRLPRISLPQIGTFHTPDGLSKNQHYAWSSWWHHSPQSVSRIDNLEIRPGQEILAGLWVMISGDVSFFIKNQSTGDFCSFCKRPPPGDIEPLGSSAEWIVERPTEPSTNKLYPLADYRSVDFRYCMARAADKPLGPGPLMTLADNGRMIKMREAFADPYRTVYVSRAKERRDRDGSIGVTCTFHEPT
ncbi:G1 family glutamic endopeptidase [Bradyrhizobium sp.]